MHEEFAPDFLSEDFLLNSEPEEEMDEDEVEEEDDVEETADIEEEML